MITRNTYEVTSPRTGRSWSSISSLNKIKMSLDHNETPWITMLPEPLSHLEKETILAVDEWYESLDEHVNVESGLVLVDYEERIAL